MMKNLFFLLLFLSPAFGMATGKLNFYGADNKNIRYVGRVDFSNPARPKFWASGAYVQFKFKGSKYEVQINDEVRYGTVLNYIEIQVDDRPAYRMQLKGRENKLQLGEGLGEGEHTVIICKNTEGENGYLEMVGIACGKLLALPAAPKRKMEFIGDSITCGFGADESEKKCGAPGANWYDQHNAWFAYGPTTARALNAQWHLSSVSGIGLIHSCCDKKILMPQVYDKINMPDNALQWNFASYQPDMVTVCLGQNDGVQDSAQFCSAYVDFAKRLRSYYPRAKLLFLSSPMADAKLKAAMVNYLTSVKEHLNRNGEQNVEVYFFKERSVKGCGSHPSLEEQQQIAGELTAYVGKIMKW